MTPSPTITKTERRQRERYVRGGEWNDAIIVLRSGRRIWARLCRVGDHGSLVVEVEGGDRLLLDFADVVRVIR